jgi:formamidopyrimidine-DNA glycosylase
MPELPEVETVRRGLERRVLGRTIVRVEVREARLRTPLAAATLKRQLVGRRIEALDRRAKYLLLHLSDAHVLVFHLGMTGRLSVEPAVAPLRPHTHVRLGLEPPDELRFADVRRFGMLFVVRRDRLDRHPRFLHLGPEPLGPGFTPEYLAERARRVRKPIKNFLMDASVVVGVGNIYATEALHRAAVHPNTPAGKLRPSRIERLHTAVREVLGEALHAGGTTLNDFADVDGAEGEFQVNLQVYGRAGEPCLRCGRTIRRSVQAGRSTFYCPGCQH